jgi:peptidyl-prolyl cis-trans isomerase C
MNTPSNNESPENKPIDISEIKVNGTVITPEDVAREMQYHASESQEAAIQKASEVLIIQELLMQKAKELGFDKDLPADSDVPKVETIIGRLIDQEAKALPVTEDECEAYYNDNKEHFVSKEMLEVKHILFGANPDDKDKRAEAKQKAEATISCLAESLEAFEALAKEHSDCPSKDAGGSIGRITHGQTTPEFDEVVFQLDEGLASEPVETKFGYHVVCVDKRLPSKQLEYEHVKDDVAHMLVEFNQRKAISLYIHTLIDAAEIEGIDFKIGQQG